MIYAFVGQVVLQVVAKSMRKPDRRFAFTQTIPVGGYLIRAVVVSRNLFVIEYTLDVPH
jgi:hypothetical protein